MFKILKTVIFTLSISMISLPVSADVFFYPIGDHNTAPLYIRENNELASGLVIDILHEIENRTDIKFEFTPVARHRIKSSIEFEHIDILCHTVPAWLSSPKNMTFPELYKSGDYFVTHIDTEYDFSDETKVKGAVLGSINGFQYQEDIQRLFDNGLIDRRASNFEVNWDRLMSKSIDVLVISDIQAVTFVNEKDNSSRFKVVDVLKDKPWRYCAVRKTHPQHDLFVNTLKGMREDSSMDKIKAKYGLFD